MKLRSFVVAAFGMALIAGLTACAPPPPESTVDQSNEPSTSTASVVANCGSTAEGQQSFTAGRTGLLDKVSLTMQVTDGSPGLDLEIRTVDGAGVATSTVIGSGSFAGPFNGPTAFTDMPLSSPAPVIAGMQYVLAFRTSPGCEGQLRAYFNFGDTYVGGQWVQQPAFDYQFRTWVR